MTVTKNLRLRAQGLDLLITRRILSKVYPRPAMTRTTILLTTDLTAGRAFGRVHLAHFLDIDRRPPKIETDEKDEPAIFHVRLRP
jgi:hypothetical protein